MTVFEAAQRYERMLKRETSSLKAAETALGNNDPDAIRNYFELVPAFYFSFGARPAGSRYYQIYMLREYRLWFYHAIAYL